MDQDQADAGRERERDRDRELITAATEEAGELEKTGVTASEEGAILQEEPLPKQISNYRILSKLGEGGMGVVYLAEQSEPVRRRVALKVVKRGMDSKQVIARFEAERQALAMMEHPCVARVFDAGIAEDGRSYFVMEHVAGVSITEHCDRQRMGIDERLALFMQVCDAVQHAHQKGIIHRDIKPSNILVSFEEDKSVPKVIDFGVAKALHQRLTEQTLFTERGQLIGTPEYMSPEQAEMTIQDIDTRSDIYSLGVLLYHLLTGALPFDPKSLRRAAFAEVQRIIREEEPKKPSTKFSSLSAEGVGKGKDDHESAASRIAHQRHADARALVRRIRGDLDWIVMKALEKDRTRRYKTASEFAAYIQKHLNGEAIDLGPPSAAYRMSKFVRRHRIGVAATAVVAAALVISTGVSIGFWLSEAEQRKLAQDAMMEAELKGETIKEAHAVVSANSEREFQQNLRRLSRGRQLELEDLRQTALRSIEGLQRLYDRDDEADPVLSRALALAYRRLGDVQGGTRTGTQGDTQAARESYHTALAILKRVNPPNADVSRDLSLAHIRIGDILRTTGNVSDALVEYESAVDNIDSLMLAGHPVDHTIAFALSSAGQALVKNGRTDEAEELLTRSLALRRQLAKAAPNNALAQLNLAKGLTAVAERRSVAGDHDVALKLYFESLGIRQRLLAEDPSNSTRRRDVAVVHYFLSSTFSALDQLEKAKPHVQSWLDYTKERAQATPDDARAQLDLGAAHELMGIILADAGEWDQASKSYRDLQEVIVPLRDSDPANTLYGRLLAFSHEGLGEVALANDELDGAVREFREALEIIVPMSEHDPADATIKSARAKVESALGDALLQNGKTDEALPHLESARELYDTLFIRDPAIVDNREGLVATLQRLASALSAQGDTAAAIKRVNEALDILDESAESATTLELRSSLKEDMARYQRESESDGK